MSLFTRHHHHYHNHYESPLVLKELHKMNQQIKDLTDAVAAQKTIIDSAVVLLNGLSDQIAGAIAKAEAGDVDALKQLVTDVNTETGALAAAVANNTPPTVPPAADPAPTNPAPATL